MVAGAAEPVRHFGAELGDVAEFEIAVFLAEDEPEGGLTVRGSFMAVVARGSGCTMLIGTMILQA